MSLNEILLVGRGLKPPSMPGDVGYNLVLGEDVELDENGIYWATVDARIKLPEGTWGFITARSSAAKLWNISIVPGVIDNGYTGPLKVGIIHYHGWAKIPAGTSVAQLVIMPMVTPKIRQVVDLPDTDRGQNGWGSTAA